MAKVDFKKIEKIEKKNISEHGEVNASYDVYEINGKRFLQIDTYGSIYREFQGKVSQSIQVDEESIKFLLELIKKNFDIK